MISTELIIVLFVFLVYLGIWYGYMNEFMDVVDTAMQRLHARNVADTIAHGINIVCINSGEIEVSLDTTYEISGNGNTINVNGIEKKVECEVSGSVKTNSIKITRVDKGVLLS